MRRIAEFLFETGQLERTPRSGYALLGCEGQSVAAHTNRVCFIGYALADRCEGADVSRVLRMALVHDLAETRTTDLHHLAQRYAQPDEARALSDAVAGLSFGEELCALQAEYKAGETLEAKIVRDADQLELLLALRERRTGEDWIRRLRKQLQTEPARVLARFIEETDPDAWWRDE